MTTTFESRRRGRERRYILRYASPAIVVLGGLVGAPLVYAIWTSLYRYSFAAVVPSFAGAENYLRLLSDPALARSLVATVAIVVPAIALEMILGLTLALAINSLTRGRALLATVLALPVMVSGASVGMAFRVILTPEWGPADQIVRTVFGARLDWLGDPELARAAVIAADVWQNTPFVMLIALAALVAMPREVLEAASVDGCTGWSRFRHVTLPLIRKFLLVALLFRLIDLFRIFDVIFVMTNGGPAGSTETISFFVYRQGIQFFDIGYAASAELCLTVATVVISRALIRTLDSGEH